MSSKMLKFLVILSIIAGVKSEVFSSLTLFNQLALAHGDLQPAMENFIESIKQRYSDINQDNSKSELEKSRFRNQVQKRLSYAESLVNSLKNCSSTIDGLPYVGHPVNAYHLARHWTKLQSAVPEMFRDGTELSNLLKEFEMVLPKDADVEGSAAALARLQDTYSISTKDMAKGEIFGFKSAKQLSIEDMFKIGKAAYDDKLFEIALEWLQRSIDDSSLPIERPKWASEAFKLLALASEKLGNIKLALGAIVAANNYGKGAPEYKEIERRLRNKKDLSDKKETKKKNNKYIDDHSKYKALCRGEKLEQKDAMGHLPYVCRYRNGKVPIINYKEEIMNWSPRISLFHDVINDQEAELLMEMAEPMLRRASVVDFSRNKNKDKKPGSGSIIKGRVSQVAWLDDRLKMHEDLTKRLSNRVSDISGLATSGSKSEPFQVLNYGIGGQYAPHVDFFSPKPGVPVDNRFRISGDRIATFLFYLTDIIHGGSTVFPKLGVRVPPTKHAAAFWYNLSPTGKGERGTLHGACPVLLGEKWVINKWMRQYGQELAKPCTLNESDPWDPLEA